MAKAEYFYGVHSVSALLKKSPERIEKLYIQQGRQDKRVQAILELAEENAVAIEWLAKAELQELVPEGTTHQGLIALSRIAKQYNERDLTELLDSVDRHVFILVLDGVQDPHNLGAILRSADAAGVDAVIAPKDRSVGLTPTVRKVACGAAETVPFIQVTNLARVLQNLQEQGVWLFGAAGEAEESLYTMKLTGNAALVLGAEGDGLRQLTKKTCDYLFKIPMYGSVSSLNVSVATGVCLFEACRQRANLS